MFHGCSAEGPRRLLRTTPPRNRRKGSARKNLHGSIKALVDILALANPLAFGRATRVRHSVEQLMTHFEIRERWPVEVAAMLSQIACVTLPATTLDKLNKGETLEKPEQGMVDRMPAVVEQCLSNIPRIDS